MATQTSSMNHDSMPMAAREGTGQGEHGEAGDGGQATDDRHRLAPAGMSGKLATYLCAVMQVKQIGERGAHGGHVDDQFRAERPNHGAMRVRQRVNRTALVGVPCLGCTLTNQGCRNLPRPMLNRSASSP